jgi:biotin carboxyl carrier protein
MLPSLNLDQEAWLVPPGKQYLMPGASMDSYLQQQQEQQQQQQQQQYQQAPVSANPQPVATLAEADGPHFVKSASAGSSHSHGPSVDSEQVRILLTRLLT